MSSRVSLHYNSESEMCWISDSNDISHIMRKTEVTQMCQQGRGKLAAEPPSLIVTSKLNQILTLTQLLQI